MANKSFRYHRDYLFWIYPIIILGLLIYTIIRNEDKRDTATRTDANVKGDSSIAISLKTNMVDTLKTIWELQ